MNKLTAAALACSLAFAAADVLAADEVGDNAIGNPMNHEVTAQEGTTSDAAANFHGMSAEPMKEEPASPDSMSEPPMKDEPSQDGKADEGAGQPAE